MPHTNKPVLFVLTSHNKLGNTGEETGFYLAELTHPLNVLEQADIPTEFASIKGGNPPTVGIDLSDEVNARYWNSADFQQKLQHTAALADINTENYSAVFFVGGHGAMWDFPNDAAVQLFARELAESHRIVAAVCHGVAALVNIKLSNGKHLVKDRHIAAFTDAEEHAVGHANDVPFLLESVLRSHGARYESAPEWQEKVVVDNRLITGQNPKSAAGVGKAIRDRLLEK